MGLNYRTIRSIHTHTERAKFIFFLFLFLGGLFLDVVTRTEVAFYCVTVKVLSFIANENIIIWNQTIRIEKNRVKLQCIALNVNV